LHTTIVYIIGSILGNVASSAIPEVQYLLQRRGDQRMTVPVCRQRHKRTDEHAHCNAALPVPGTGLLSLISGYDETAAVMYERDWNILASESQSAELTATVTVQSINARNSLSPSMHVHILALIFRAGEAYELL